MTSLSFQDNSDHEFIRLLHHNAQHRIKMNPDLKDTRDSAISDTEKEYL